MAQPDNQDWEDIVAQDWEDIIATPTDVQRGPEKAGPEKAGPFATAHPVDGYAFTLDAESPELRYERQPHAAVPAPPRREPPRRIRDQVPVRGVWQPGGSARTGQPKVQTPGPSIVKALLSGLVPLTLLGGGIYLVMRVCGF